MNKTSLAKLNTCDPRLVKLAHAVDMVYPIQCICGHRKKDAQDEAYKAKVSKLKWPDSKHNKLPSLAADFVPDPDRNPATVDWNDTDQFILMCSFFELKAKELGIEIRLGRDFKFKDYPHIEIVED